MCQVCEIQGVSISQLYWRRPSNQDGVNNPWSVQPGNRSTQRVIGISAYLLAHTRFQPPCQHCLSSPPRHLCAICTCLLSVTNSQSVFSIGHSLTRCNNLSRTIDPSIFHAFCEKFERAAKFIYPCDVYLWLYTVCHVLSLLTRHSNNLKRFF